MRHTGPLIVAGESADTYRLATALLGDRHDLIHKATGWMLREAGRRVSRAELLQFLDAYAPRMPRTALRYAIEHLPAERRQVRRLAPGVAVDHDEPQVVPGPVGRPEALPVEQPTEQLAAAGRQGLPGGRWAGEQGGEQEGGPHGAGTPASRQP